MADESIADQVYAVLVEEAGAPERERDAFVGDFQRFVRMEWRFGGDLGFGGKFWKQERPHALMRVGCYPEDMTPKRKRIVAATNDRLAELLPGADRGGSNGTS